jgi:hypothetical protein
MPKVGRLPRYLDLSFISNLHYSTRDVQVGGLEGTIWDETNELSWSL